MGITSLSNTNEQLFVCITLQIGERGNFTDVQIGKRGKQRVKERYAGRKVCSCKILSHILYS